MSVITSRLEIRAPEEADRGRFIDLFCDDEFMIFSSGTLTREAAHRRFNHMLTVCHEVAFAKQPVVERMSGVIVGYIGVDWFEFENARWLEFGYRLAPEFRGKGYATEAGRALLATASESFAGDLIAIIHPDNAPSQNVCRKLGFQYLKRARVDGEVRDVHRIRLVAPIDVSTQG